jgi:DNA-directed RNA polymerase subunit RPC12/RpoP
MEENAPKQGASEPAIRFNCHFCGKQIHVSSIHAGKKGKCPQCKSHILIPDPASSAENKLIEHGPDLDLFLQPGIAREHVPADLPKDRQYETLRQNAGYEPPQPPPQRRYPALVDIFLYPANTHGLIFLAIAVIVPLLVQLVSPVLCIFAILLYIIDAVIVMYVYWFLAQCVRDSAAGGLRTPETLGETPGMGELAWQLLEILACIAICAAPASAYYTYTHKIDSLFWCLAGVGAFIYPMALLSVIMFDSMNGLNPLIIIPSIFSAFFQYCGLVILISAIVFLYVKTMKLLPDDYFMKFVLSPIVQTIELYLAMIAMHLLGRFYFKYQEKLNWEV